MARRFDRAIAASYRVLEGAAGQVAEIMRIETTSRRGFAIMRPVRSGAPPVAEFGEPVALAFAPSPVDPAAALAMTPVICIW